MRIATFLGVLAASMVTMAGTAIADGPGGGGSGFGHAGQLAVTWDQALGSTFVVSGNTTGLGGPGSWSMLDFQYVSLSNNGGSGTHFGLAPSAHYFVIDNLSVGGQVMFGMTNVSPANGGQSTSFTSWGIAPEVGYNVGLTDNLSVWPKAFFGYQSSSQSNNGPTVNTSALGVYVPVLYHPTNHFFVGIGPNFSLQLSGSASQNGQSVDTSKATVFGLFATFGGYFLGD